MRGLLFALAIVMGSICGVPVRAADTVLLVVSGHGRGGGSARPGFEFDEFAQAWTVFRSNGLQVEVASPAGGRVEPDAYEPDKPYNAAALGDPAAIAALASTRRIDALDAKRYSAIYVLGGGGAMFDVLADPALPLLLSAAYQHGAIVGGVCHGPVVLSRVRLPDGRPLVRGRRVTGFTNAEEAAFGSQWVRNYPVSLESALLADDAHFEEGPVMLPHVVVDGRIVTGQNPSSSAITAEAMIRALHKKPVTRNRYPDERSLLLVKRFLAGDRAAAEAALRVAPARHDIMLIGQYGNAIVEQAGDDTNRKALGLAIMAMAATHLTHPRLELAIAQAELRLGRCGAARKRLEAVLARDPANSSARRMLGSIGS